MRNFCIIIFVLCFALTGCHKKEHYEPSVSLNEPVFQVSGSVNGTPLLLQAGVDGYYMSASHRLDSGGVYVYTGALQQTNCVNCGPQLQVEIRAYRPFSPAMPVSIDSALQVKPYNFQDDSSKYTFEASFQSSFEGTPNSYYWNFGDGAVSYSPTPKHVYKKRGTYPVCLTITGGGSVQSTICNPEIISNPEFRSTIGETQNPTGKTVTFTQQTLGQAPFTFSWKFGDGDTSNLPSPVHTYPSVGVYNVQLKVKDVHNNIYYAGFNAYTDSVYNGAANYSFSLLPIVDLALGQTRLTWTDAQGNVYSSGSGPQIAGSYFKILDVQDYAANQNGDRAKKLQLQFSCRLYRGNQYITMNNVQAVIAIAYP